MNTPYPNAPITEAVIDIRVEVSPSTTLTILESLQAEGYPAKQQRFMFQGSFLAGGQVSASAMQVPAGYIYNHENGKQSFQAGLDGFTFSRLAPYQHWEVFRDEAKRLWELYKAVLQPSRISRMAVRYINRIDVPLPINDFGKWLNALPVVAEDAGKDLSGFFMQVQIPQPDIEARVVLREAVVESARPDEIVSILLDIDLFKVDNLPQEENKIWDEFETFRGRKNKIFRACITEETEDLFK